MRIVDIYAKRNRQKAEDLEVLATKIWGLPIPEKTKEAMKILIEHVIEASYEDGYEEGYTARDHED